MNYRISIFHVYLVVILLCALNGTLYAPGGFIAQSLQYIFILLSLYYTFYANFNYKLPLYFKALNVLLVMFTIYGFLLMISGEKLMVANLMGVSSTYYLKTIYQSLLPVYPFFVFTKQGLLKENTIKILFFVFLFLNINSYYRSQERLLQAAIDRGSSAEEFTSNVGYVFVAMLPALILFYKKPVLQYLGIAVCFYFIMISMKRGAILAGLVCMAWFMVASFKKVPKRKRWMVMVFSLALVVAGFYLFNYLMETSVYFQSRFEQTESGDTSGRDVLYKYFFNHFINEDDLLRLLFGYGADGTLKIGDNYAHNDWLEIATNQGFFGLTIYLFYWICFIISWRKLKHNPQAFMAIGMIVIVYFVSTLFSMSYNSVSRCAAMVLGYYLAVAEEPMCKDQEIAPI